MKNYQVVRIRSYKGNIDESIELETTNPKKAQQEAIDLYNHLSIFDKKNNTIEVRTDYKEIEYSPGSYNINYNTIFKVGGAIADMWQGISSSLKNKKQEDRI